ncbi:hypothetical protein P872_21370 [Rhodonellum psychrophilum GCM71 = DSM 17998]|uniref:Uncharacterized protein n=1 Tax=Rhodonellum psychrophilum GCM71 = DSM 17998 TaxID=1123057 RepID=U5BXT8_9BACT|nr:hypothetical protein P872_21370 [Rhodonellum psychrophilum GCM71 = DSM 17998]
MEGIQIQYNILKIFSEIFIFIPLKKHLKNHYFSD